ncbi:methylated-DNA--[protein]-cysteine S-methyltransferase [Ensifer sp.]|jgi:O-6-methylguanine DNA methyltransferase|uniref:methylated-DNA--[protein]-cysteine S-methyltransferase n=1 Tax=Ensifer sp. TaxID=1872086 RepID=UPI002E137AA7|nr:methylated-DNA--[protein]-cysteine S-methyltransferase [Ensifer sp.]
MNLLIKTDHVQPSVRQISPSTIADVISYAVFDCDLGKGLVARSANGVCAILLGDTAEALTADLHDRFPYSTLVASEAMVRDDIAKILRYLAEPSHGLHLALDMRGTPFQRRVSEKLKAIPPGRTVSYTELSRWVGPLANPRAVAGACAANPVALAIPCHRVLRADGTLAGFRWGIKRKRVLIEKEARA